MLNYVQLQFTCRIAFKKICDTLTRNKVKAFLILHAGFNLTGEQVESGGRFVRLKSRKNTADKIQLIKKKHRQQRELSHTDFSCCFYLFIHSYTRTHSSMRDGQVTVVN